MELEKVKEPETVTFLTLNGNLRYPVRIGTKLTKLAWTNCNLTLNKEKDKKVIEELRKTIDSQWVKDENDEYIKDDSGNRVSQKTIPFWEDKAFEATIVKDDQPINIPDGKGGVVKITPEKIRELNEKDNLNKKEE